MIYTNMKLTQRMFVNLKHEYYNECDVLCFKSKNLYNAANYTIRQYYLLNNKFINYHQLDKLMQKHEAYKALPAKVSQQTLMILDKNWKSFFNAQKSFKENPQLFNKAPKPPQYLDKQKGRFLTIYSTQATKKNNILSKTNIQIKTDKKYTEIRIVPKQFGYIIEIVYEQECKDKKENGNYCSIDLGVNNLATITSNQTNPILINGRIVKSINQFYNKKLSQITSKKKRNRLIQKRYFRLENYFHHVSKFIINYCNKNNISKIIIGYNKEWKQNINLSKKTNQSFCFIPYLNLINKIKYKSELEGIELICVEESYTSKASALDNDLMIKGEFSGKRIKRGLYRSKDGFIINADVNGSLNIGRKVIHELVVDRSLVARPLKVNPLKT